MNAKLTPSLWLPSTPPNEFYHLQEVSLYVIKVPLALLSPQMGTIERQFARSLSIDEGAGRLLVFQIRQILELIQQHRLAALEIKILEQQLLNLTVGTPKAHRALRPSAPRKLYFNPSDGRCCLSYIGQILA